MRRFGAFMAGRREGPPGWVDEIRYPSDEEIRTEPTGCDLACWCRLDQPCHGDVLLTVADPR